MKVAAALHSVQQRSRSRCLLTELRPVKDISRKGDLRAWMTYLSDGWYPDKESQLFPVQTMRVAAALHTLRQHEPRRLASRAESCERGETTNIVSQGAPVRWLACTSRKLNIPSIDHEGGSCPAHCEAALTTGMLAHRSQSSPRHQRKKELAGSKDTPVRELECISRLLKLPSADHEDGTGPAHHEAALMAAMLAC